MTNCSTGAAAAETVPAALPASTNKNLLPNGRGAFGPRAQAVDKALSTAFRLSTKAVCAGLCRQDTFPLRLGARPGKRAGKPCCARLPNPPRMSPGSDCIWRASALQASPKGFFDGLRPAQTTFQRIDKLNTLMRGCRKGRQAPSYLIRSGGVYTARSGCKPLPLSCSARALCAQEHDVPFAARLLRQPCGERP